MKLSDVIKSLVELLADLDHDPDVYVQVGSEGDPLEDAYVLTGRDGDRVVLHG